MKKRNPFTVNVVRDQEQPIGRLLIEELPEQRHGAAGPIPVPLLPAGAQRAAQLQQPIRFDLSEHRRRVRYTEGESRPPGAAQAVRISGASCCGEGCRKMTKNCSGSGSRPELLTLENSEFRGSESESKGKLRRLWIVWVMISGTERRERDWSRARTGENAARRRRSAVTFD